MNQEFNQTYGKSIIEKRDGLLAKQLGNCLSEDDRPSYTQFLKILRNLPDVRVSKFTSKNKALFVTTCHGVPLKRKKLMIMLAAGEAKEKKEALGYKNIGQLFTIYDFLIQLFPATSKDAQTRTSQKAVIEKLRESRDWLIEHNENRLVTFKMANEKSQKMESGTSEKQNHKLGKIDSVPKIVTYIKPEISLLNLFSRGIYLSISPKNNNSRYYIFHYFDIDDDLIIGKLRNNVAMIFEFLAYYDIVLPFKIKVHTWNERKRELYEKHFSVSKANIERITIVKYSQKHKLFSKEIFLGIEYDSLDSSTFLNEKKMAYGKRIEKETRVNKSNPEEK